MFQVIKTYSTYLGIVKGQIELKKTGCWRRGYSMKKINGIVKEFYAMKGKKRFERLLELSNKHNINIAFIHGWVDRFDYWGDK